MTETRRTRGRPRREIPGVELTVTLPIHVKNILLELLRDPVYTRPAQGALSNYVTALIIADLRRQGHSVLPPKVEEPK